MTRSTRFSIGLASLPVLLASLPTSAAEFPQDFVPLPEEVQTVDIKGRRVVVKYRPALKIRTSRDGIEIEIFVRGDLRHLQAEIAPLLSGQKQNEECGKRASVDSVTARTEGDALHLRGTVHYEQWKCRCAQIPEFHGFKVKRRTRCVKSRLFRQSARVCVKLRPKLIDHGARLGVTSEVTCARPTSGRILGALSNIMNLENTFKGLIRGEVEKAVRKLTLAFPREVMRFHPRFRSVRFYDLGGGILGLEARASARASRDQLPRLLELMK